MKDIGDMDEKHEMRRLRVRGVLVLLVSGVCIAVAAASALAAVPPTAIEMSDGNREAVRAVLPEGWSFFTRNPREERLRPWRRSGSGGWTDAAPGHNAGPDALFGVHRGATAHSVELGTLQQAALKRGAKWFDCQWADVTSCLSSAPPTATVRNAAPRRTYCGQIGISAQAPTPWAWARDGARAKMPYKVLRVEVTC